MYLKSIEVQGFKSFANKMSFQFHNGITGIVGPNGSGKSNVSDAVRWVLGEQSAKQLRGASMQDVIFSGTENRKPLSYAYVAITMDNSDHVLDIDFNEVTVARRVYRSGESEYLLNGSPCRLKDVNELFYDTGIGKEGYSIIGQGQIEKILSGRPEEKRELFDEAAGIVKYKRRKMTAQKKLETERENLVRIQDILSELERQVGPLLRQSEKARAYLKKKEELKQKDIDLFLWETDRVNEQIEETMKSYGIAEAQLKETGEVYEQIKIEYKKMEAAIEAIGAEIEQSRENLNQSVVLKGKLEGQADVLNEQIKAAEASDGHLKERAAEIRAELEEKIAQKQAYEAGQAELEEMLAKATERRERAQAGLKDLKESIRACSEGAENGKNELMELLSRKARAQAAQQKFRALSEQAGIRKAELTKRLLQQKSSESGLDLTLGEQRQALKDVQERIAKLRQEEEGLLASGREWERKLAAESRMLEEDTAKYHKAASRLESLRNIAERYDGYGGSIRKVMAKKDSEPGILGVVSDLIKVEKTYETAIETALGGSIQNIVTKDDETAKKMIAYLKRNRLGRATFLPLTSVNGKAGIKYPEALKEPGVVGLANELAQCDGQYRGITAQLLGRVVVVDTIDHAVALAKKYRHSLSIVTLEGESLRPGGSMTGGAFQNSSNLLSRNREIEDLSVRTQELEKTLKERRARREEIRTAQALAADGLAQARAALQQQYLLENTAKLNEAAARQQKEESDGILEGLQRESAKLDQNLQEMKAEADRAAEEIGQILRREEELAKESREYQDVLGEKLSLEERAGTAVSEAQMEEAKIRQSNEFSIENIRRVALEIEKNDAQLKDLASEAASVKENVRQKRDEVEAIRQAACDADEERGRLELDLKEKIAAKDTMMSNHKGFFDRREEISARMADLDKEVFRLNGQREKLEELKKSRIDYMWEEYELTLHAAAAFRSKPHADAGDVKKQIARLKDEIKSLGDVNVNAIEEYKEVSQRYEFLKSQHDDLIEAEAALVGIIDELDTGMREQFTKKFAEIRREFDQAFKELFGGGKGTLELVEDEDILECGIRITAQPPGKKLQNMILLSGGEKSLTAIALLFAIQNLKPSPFCLLDEIEAALDDSNVGRFAKYLHKLTKNTQFIVITHRRGTMASADRLYGITMQEKGVSALVSVDLVEHDLK